MGVSRKVGNMTGLLILESVIRDWQYAANQ